MYGNLNDMQNTILRKFTPQEVHIQNHKSPERSYMRAIAARMRLSLYQSSISLSLKPSYCSQTLICQTAQGGPDTSDDERVDEHLVLMDVQETLLLLLPRRPASVLKLWCLRSSGQIRRHGRARCSGRTGRHPRCSSSHHRYCRRRGADCDAEM